MALHSTVMIWVINDEMIDPDVDIEDFTDDKWKGYSLFFASMLRYHASMKPAGTYSYGQLFDQEEEDAMVTLRVDLSQKTRDSGVLRFEISAKRAEEFAEVSFEETDNTLYDDLDITGQYRMAVAVQTKSSNDVALSLV